MITLVKEMVKVFRGTKRFEDTNASKVLFSTLLEIGIVPAKCDDRFLDFMVNLHEKHIWRN